MFTDEITKIEEFEKILIEKNNKLEEYEIEEVRYHKNQALIKFKGIDTIESAELLKNCFIKVHRSSEKQLPENTYYIADLIGIDVYLDTGEKLGILKEIFPVHGGSNDVYVVKTEQKDILLPAIGDVIKEVNIPENKIIVHLLDGLV